MIAAIAILGLSLLFWLFTAVLWQLTRPPRPSVCGHHCGGCGYDARGLPTPICPECGADLRVVGTVDPTRRRRPWWAFAAGWTALVGVGTLLLAPLAVGHLGFARREVDFLWVGAFSEASFSPSDTRASPATPPAGLLLTLQAKADEFYWLGWPMPLRYDAPTLTAAKLDGPRLRLGAALTTATLVDATGRALRPAGPLDGQAILALTAAAGSSAATVASRDVAEVAVATMLSTEQSQFPAGGLFYRYGGSSGTSRGKLPGSSLARSGRRIIYSQSYTSSSSADLHPLTLLLLLFPLALWWFGLRLDRRRRALPSS